MQHYDKLEAAPLYITAEKFHRSAKVTYKILAFGFLIGAALGVFRSFQLKAAIPTQAVVTQFIETKDDYGTTYYKPEYQFTDQAGNEVTAVSGLHDSQPKVEVGDAITILYFPKNSVSLSHGTRSSSGSSSSRSSLNRVSALV